MQAYKGMCYVPLNRVWFSRSWVFRVYNFTIKRLEQGVFLDWKPFRECVSPVLNRGTKWAIFVLTRVGVWRSRRHSSTQTSFECPPPPESKEVWWELKRGDCVRIQRVKIYHLAVLAFNSFSLCGRCKKETGRGRGQKREREKGVPYQPSLPNPLPFSLSPNTPAYQVETLKFNMTASLRGDKQRKWG